MQKSNRTIPFDILKILKEYTDESHHLQQTQIAEKLISMGYETMNRKTVGSNIESILKDGLGLDIRYENKESKEKGYYILKDELEELEDDEIRMLIDMVLSSKYLTNSDAEELINKLTKFGNKYLKQKIGKIFMHKDFYHVDNHQTFSNISNINSALDEYKKIKFSICRYNSKKELVPYQKNITFNPYALYSVNGKYMLIGNIDIDDKIVAYDVSKIKNLEVLNDIRKKTNLTEIGGQKLSSYIKSHPNLTGGVNESISILIKENALDNLIDTFGIDVKIREIKEPVDDFNLIADFNASKNDVIDFVLKNSANVNIISPQSIRDEIRNISINIKIDYSDTNQDRYNMAIQKFNLSAELYNYCISENELNLDDVDLSKINDFSEIKNVCKLNLCKNNISDFSFLKEFKELHFLSIRENQIDSLDFIKYLPELQVLNLYWNDIKDISALKDNLALRSLKLCNKDKMDLSVVYDLRNIEYLLIVGPELNIDLNTIEENNPKLLLTKSEDGNQIESNNLQIDYSININSNGLQKNNFIHNIFLYTFGNLDRYDVAYPKEELKNDESFKQKLYNLLKDLSEVRRTFLLETFNGKTIKEIANSLNVSIGDLINCSIEEEIELRKEMEQELKVYIDYNKYIKNLNKYVSNKDKERIKKIVQERKRNIKIKNNL